MFRRVLLVAMAAAALVAAWNLDLGPSSGRALGQDLFYNYYVPPGPYGQVGAQLYPCPRPTPPLVGWTYVTYQPLSPHEFLYKHHRTYKVCHPNDGPTKVKVHWW